MKYFFLFSLILFLNAFDLKADTITFWHFHKNELSINDNCFDNKTCFHHDLKIVKTEINDADTFYILFGGCSVPENLTISLKSKTGKNSYRFQLTAKDRGDFIIMANELLKIKPDEYAVELYCDKGDNLKYFGSLVLM